MRIKLGTLEITIHRRTDRPKWRRIPAPRRAGEQEKLAYEVLTHACKLYGVDPYELKGGNRKGDYPHTRKLASKTLYDLGYGEVKINGYLGEYLGTRCTIRSQRAAVDYMPDVSYPIFHKHLRAMREKFLNS
jgi:hypothetical protein